MRLKDKIRKEVEAAPAQPEAMTPERIARAYRNVFSDGDGAIVLEDLRRKFNGSTVRLRPSGIDPYEVVFREGQRSLYLNLCERMEPPVAVTHDEDDA